MGATLSPGNMKRNTLFLSLFVIVSVTEILSLGTGSLVHMISKSLIVLSLVGYYTMSVEKRDLLFVVALLFCWAGDVFLLFHGELFFMLGLVAFLIGHVLYIFSYRHFQSIDTAKALLNTQKIRFSFPIILAGTGLIVILFPTLGDLKIPVVVYAVVLMLMVMTALFRYGRTPSASFWMVFVGAALFMTSDSLLAINKFYSPVRFSGILVMMTYISAQYLIVRGVVQHSREMQ